MTMSIPNLRSSGLRGLASLALRGEQLVRPVADARVPVTSVLILEYMLPLGSCLHMTPVYEALRRRSDLHITVATRGLALALLRHSPHIDDLIETPDPLTDLSGAVRSLRKQLRQRGLDPQACLTGVPDQRTRIALLGAGACRSWRGGFTVLSSLYQRPLTIDARRSQIANNLRLAAMLGCEGPLLEPRVFYTQADADHARGLLAPARASGRPSLIVVSQTSSGQRTGWRMDRFAQVLRHAHTQLGYEPVLVGTAADQPAVEQLQQAAGGIGRSLTGQTSVTQLAALVALGDLGVTLDTGTMHMMRAVGLPMAVLGPSWQKPHEWLPLGKPNVRILRGEDRSDIPPDYQLDEITAEAVSAATDDLSALYPADESAREQRLARNLSSIDHLRR